MSALQAQVSDSGATSSIGHRDFLKKWTVESFGYALAPLGPGFETRGPQISSGQANPVGVECPYCALIPLQSRVRSTLPPFGARATRTFLDGRGELFLGVTGVEAWLPDGALRPGRRATTFNDSWLMQGEAGANIAVDRQRRLWMGLFGRYLENFGEGKEGRRHWNSFGASTTLRLGR